MLKFYETQFDEYTNAAEKYDLHPELAAVSGSMPPDIKNMSNMIIHGPSGVGKYTQLLRILKRYSPSDLKYEKKLTVQTDKIAYTYSISDVHYEIDMSILGCNSKALWTEIFQQIVDIVLVKPDKFGIIVCKNFHHIHTELLEIFYSYMQQYNHAFSNIQIRFIIVSEHISFIPDTILNSCYILSVGRPTQEKYTELFAHFSGSRPVVMDIVSANQILNIKEIRPLTTVTDTDKYPEDFFNIICDTIIHEMENHDKIVMTAFRDIIYDILIYNLDIGECLWYIMSHFIRTHPLPNDVVKRMTEKTFSFLKYYNNNYRPIYHLESILFYFIVNIFGYSKNEIERSL